MDNAYIDMLLYLITFLKVESSIVHIMKALADHPAAALSLIEDTSLQLLFEMVSNGSLIFISRYKEGLAHLHSIQLHRHAMQVPFKLNELIM